MPWGIVSLVFVIPVGSLTCSLYALIALLTGDGDWGPFSTGRRWQNQVSEGRAIAGPAPHYAVRAP